MSSKPHVTTAREIIKDLEKVLRDTRKKDLPVIFEDGTQSNNPLCVLSIYDVTEHDYADVGQYIAIDIGERDEEER